MFRRAYPRLGFWLFLLPFLLGVRGTAFGATDLTIYDEALAPGWQNWSWATVDTASTANANTGAVSIAVTAPAWSALYLRSADAPLDTNGYLNFTFYVHGGATGGQTIQVVAVIGDAPQPGVRVATPTAGAWQKITVPLAALGVENRTDVSGFWVQQGSGVDEPTFYVDTVVLESGVPPTPPPPVNGMAIYQDSLVNGWNNWSWACVNTANTTTVHTGSNSIAVTADAFEALYLQHAALPTDAYESLKFWIHGGATGGQTLNVVALESDVAQPAVPIGPLPAGAWQEIVIPLAQLGIANIADLSGLWLQDNSGTTQPTFFVDDVSSRVRAAAERGECHRQSEGAHPQGRPAHVRHQRGGLGWRIRLAEHHGAADGAQQPGAAFPGRLAVGCLSLADEHERRSSNLRMGHQLR